MQLIEPSFISLVSAYLFFGGCLIAVIWWISIIYLKYKWLSFVEEVIDENYYSFSSNIFSAGLGISRYALIFMFDWQAKRCKRLKQRNLVPKRVQRLFIISISLWLVAGIIVLGSWLLALGSWLLGSLAFFCGCCWLGWWLCWRVFGRQRRGIFIPYEFH